MLQDGRDSDLVVVLPGAEFRLLAVPLLNAGRVASQGPSQAALTALTWRQEVIRFGQPGQRALIGKIQRLDLE